MYTQILYYALEIQSGFANIHLSNPTILTIGFFANDIIRLIIPPLIITHEVNTVVKNNQQKYSPSDHDDHKYGNINKGEFCTLSSSVMKDMDSNGAKEGNISSNSNNFPSSPSNKQSLNWGRYLSMRQKNK